MSALHKHGPMTNTRPLSTCNFHTYLPIDLPNTHNPLQPPLPTRRQLLLQLRRTHVCANTQPSAGSDAKPAFKNSNSDKEKFRSLLLAGEKLNGRLSVNVNCYWPCLYEYQCPKNIRIHNSKQTNKVSVRQPCKPQRHLPSTEQLKLIANN